jgi:transposase
LSDLPWEEIPVRIDLRVRRFFCDTEDCGQHIFTERLPKTVQRYARRTCRLSTSLQQITFALGGSAGSRLAKHLGQWFDTTASVTPQGDKASRSGAPGVRHRRLGLAQGPSYGTILCDLERGKVIDLLPGRSAESTAEWLRAHPGTAIVSRDRASLYAQAATSAAPHAVQVADRRHLLDNLTEAFIGALAPHHRLLAVTARALASKPGTPSALPPAEVDKPILRNQA